MVENILTFMGNQILCGNVLSFINLLFILKIDICFHFQNFVSQKFSNPLSVRLDIFRDCIRLKLSIFEYDPLKPNLYSDSLMMDSTFSLMLDGRTKVIAFVSQPLGR